MNTENFLTFLPCTESDDEESEEDSEEEVEGETGHGRPERIQDIDTHTPVAFPTTAETSPGSRDAPTSKPTVVL